MGSDHHQPGILEEIQKAIETDYEHSDAPWLEARGSYTTGICARGDARESVVVPNEEHRSFWQSACKRTTNCRYKSSIRTNSPRRSLRA